MIDRTPEELIERYFDGVLSDHERVELQQLLRTSEPARQLLWEQGAWHLALRDASELKQFATEAVAVPDADSVGPSVADAASVGMDASSVRNGVGVASLWRSAIGAISSPGRFGLFFATVSTISLLLFFAQIKISSPTSPPADPVDSVDPTPRAAVAQIARTEQSRWADADGALKAGANIAAGQTLDLRAGKAEFTLATGATVTLEAPAKLRVDSAGGVTLHAGRLVAHVPYEARGFTVATSSVTIIDLGTVFAVEAEPAGTSYVDVYQGSVRVESLGRAPASAIFHSGDTVQIVRAGADVRLERVALRHAERPLGIDPQDPQLTVRQGLALWLAADRQVETDESGRVVAWKDLATEDDDGAHDARQDEPGLRPLWVERAIGERPAVRFDGRQTCLVTPPLETAASQTVLVVCTPSAEELLASRAVHLLNYNGCPAIALLQEKGLQEKGGRMLLRVNFCPQPGEVQRHELRSGPVQTGQPLVVAVVYDALAERAEIYCNGRREATAAMSGSLAGRSPKWLGSHPWGQDYYAGDLAEALIYNGVLPPAALDEVQQYLLQKYRKDFSVPDAPPQAPFHRKRVEHSP